MHNVMVKIRKQTNAEGTENFENVIIELFGNRYEHVSGKHDF